MAQPHQCPQCGSPLAPNAPQGLCPACLFKQGLAANTAGFTFDRPNSSRWTPPTVEDLAPRFPELEILELIGRGGMGAVYKARQKQLDRFVALKILPPEIGRDPSGASGASGASGGFAERFAREAQAMAKLSHPHIVTIHDFGHHDELFFFVMEYVDGLNLRQVLNAGGIAPKEALAIVPQICDALQFAHDHGIVHRDIKPENILLNKLGQVKIADFGLVKLMHHTADTSTSQAVHTMGNQQSQIGNIVGTPHYMAPEQADHPSDVDHRADIYALGVVFYQMLTGELPSGRFEPPSHKVQIDVRLDEVVLRALEKEPSRRYQNASEIKTEVETIVQMSTPAADVDENLHREQLQRYDRRAPGWVVRCLTCGVTEPWGKYGIRLGASGRRWTLGWCSRCHRIRRHVIEKRTGKPVVPVTGSSAFRFIWPGLALTLIVIAFVTGLTMLLTMDRNGDALPAIVPRQPPATVTAQPNDEAATQGSFDPEFERLLSSHADLQDSFLNLDDGQVLSAPSALVEQLRKNRQLNDGSPHVSALRSWMHGSGADLVKRTALEGVLLVDGMAIIVGETTGADANPTVFDTISAEEVVRSVEMAEAALQQAPHTERQFTLGPHRVYAVKTREGRVGLVEVLDDDPQSDGARLAYKLVTPPATAAAPTTHTTAAGMVDALKGMYASAYIALMEKNDPETARIALEAMMPRLDEFQAMLHGTPAQQPIAAAIDQVKLMVQALRDGNIDQAKTLMKGLDLAGPGLEKLVKELGRPSTEEATQVEASLPGFGTVIERTVHHTDADCMIDLDQGLLMTPPRNAFEQGSASALTWIAQHGVDAGGMVSDSLRGLIGFDMSVHPTTSNHWDGITSAAVQEILSLSKPGNPVYLTTGDSLPATYLIKTREGGVGVLQIVEFTDKPRAVRIRYKMIRVSQNNADEDDAP